MEPETFIAPSFLLHPSLSSFVHNPFTSRTSSTYSARCAPFLTSGEMV
jgi:hypothetical protein